MRVAYKPMKIPSSPKTPPPILIKDFLGVDFATDPTVIDNRRSPDMLNMIPDTSGILNKRTGCVSALEASLSSDKPIRGIFTYRKSDASDVVLVACNGKLYEFLPEEI